jgi:hypothetical protein
MNIGDTYNKVLERTVFTSRLPTGPMIAGILPVLFVDNCDNYCTVGFELFFVWVFRFPAGMGVL